MQEANKQLRETLQFGSWFPRRELNVRVRKFGGRQYIARGPEIYELTDVASLIWRASDGNRSIRQIAEAITEEYETTLEDALRDAVDFISELERLAFIRVIRS